MIKGLDCVLLLMILKLMFNVVGGNILIWYGLKGINYMVVIVCVSVMNVIGDVFKVI